MKKNPSYHRNQASISLFETAQTLESLSKQGNPLEFVSRIVDFEIYFEEILNSFTMAQCEHCNCVKVKNVPK